MTCGKGGGGNYLNPIIFIFVVYGVLFWILFIHWALELIFRTPSPNIGLKIQTIYIFFKTQKLSCVVLIQ